MYPPPPPYPLPYPDPRRSRLPRWIWVMVGLCVAVLATITIAGLSWATRQHPDPNDNQAYRYGHSIGPSAVSQVGAGVLPGSACQLLIDLEAGIGFYDLGGHRPDWWDTTEVRRGCVNYLHERGY